MKRLLMFLAISMVGGLAPLFAIPITYTHTFTGTGSFGGSPYTNTLVTLAFVGDTNNVAGATIFVSGPGVATVSASGLGSATFINNIQVVDNQDDARVGISDFTVGRAILFTDNAAFATYDLRSSTGPLSGPPVFNPGFLFPTTSGNFSISSISGNSTFTAIAAPESASIILLCTGGFWLAFLQFRLKRLESRPIYSARLS